MVCTATAWLHLATTRIVAMKKQATDKGSVDHKDDDRSPLFARIVLALAIAAMMVLTVAWLMLIGYVGWQLVHWIAG
jgi:hypothetical protein